MRIEIIIWEDIFDLGDTWTTTKKALKEAKKDGDYFLFSQVGYVLEETEHYVLLCSVFGADKAIGPATRLPKAIIKERKILQE